MPTHNNSKMKIIYIHQSKPTTNSPRRLNGKIELNSQDMVWAVVCNTKRIAERRPDTINYEETVCGCQMLMLSIRSMVYAPVSSVHKHVHSSHIMHALHTYTLQAVKCEFQLHTRHVWVDVQYTFSLECDIFTIFVLCISSFSLKWTL